MKKTLFALSAPLLLATAAHAQENPTTMPALAPQPPVLELQPHDGEIFKFRYRNAEGVEVITTQVYPRRLAEVSADPQKNVPIDPQFNRNRSTGPNFPHGAIPFEFNDKTHYYVPIKVGKQEK